MTPKDSLRRLSGQFTGFVTVGAVNTVLTFLLYELLNLFMPYWLAFTLSFAAGIVFSLSANAGLVFGQRVTAKSAAYFLAFYLLSYAISLGIVTFLVEGLGVSSVIAPLGAIAVMVPINFLGVKRALAARR